MQAFLRSGSGGYGECHRQGQGHDRDCQASRQIVTEVVEAVPTAQHGEELWHIKMPCGGASPGHREVYLHRSGQARSVHKRLLVAHSQGYRTLLTEPRALRVIIRRV